MMDSIISWLVYLIRRSDSQRRPKKGSTVIPPSRIITITDYAAATYAANLTIGSAFKIKFKFVMIISP